MKLLGGLFLALFTVFVHAVDVPPAFDDVRQQQRYQALLAEIRCLVCQNQSLADSPAHLARDLRHEIYKMIQQGKSNDDVIDFLVARYGDFVHYRPPLKGSTLLLWFGPFLILLVACVSVFIFIRSRKPEKVNLGREEQERLSRLLNGRGKEQE